MLALANLGCGRCTHNPAPISKQFKSLAYVGLERFGPNDDEGELDRALSANHQAVCRRSCQVVNLSSLEQHRPCRDCLRRSHSLPEPNSSGPKQQQVGWDRSQKMMRAGKLQRSSLRNARLVLIMAHSFLARTLAWHWMSQMTFASRRERDAPNTSLVRPARSKRHTSRSPVC